jgi:hypothetical protein
MLAGVAIACTDSREQRARSACPQLKRVGAPLLLRALDLVGEYASEDVEELQVAELERGLGLVASVAKLVQPISTSHTAA